MESWDKIIPLTAVAQEGDVNVVGNGEQPEEIAGQDGQEGIVHQKNCN